VAKIAPNFLDTDNFPNYMWELSHRTAFENNLQNSWGLGTCRLTKTLQNYYKEPAEFSRFFVSWLLLYMWAHPRLL